MLSKFVRADQKIWDTHIDFIVMAYNTTPQESTGVSPHRLVYGEEMLMPLDIMTEDTPESHGSEVNPSQYATDLRIKIKKMYELVREHLQEAACRQKKQYDCRVKEHSYCVGDKVWRNQWQSPPGIKASIRRHWTGPWMVIEKLCDVLFRLKHSANSPSVVIHGDNLKRYHGDRQLDFQVPQVVERAVRFPDITGFTGTNSRSDQECEGYNQNERGSMESSDHSAMTDRSRNEQAVDQFVTDTLHACSQDSSFGQQAELPNNSSISISPSNQHYSRSPVSIEVADQTSSTPTICMAPSENLEEQSDSQLFTTLAEQSQKSQVARGTFRTLPAEQHVQSDQVEHNLTPIQSQTIRRSRRTIKQPFYLKDFVLSVDTMHQCDTCGRVYTLKRNLVRHVTEKHSVIEYWNCTEFGCPAKFIRRGYLSKHLGKKHGFDKLTASMKAVGAPRGDRQERYEPELEDISEDESILDLLNDIDELSTQEPSKSDENNNCVLDQYVVPDAESNSVGIQDLEDISDSELVCVNNDGSAVCDGNSGDGARSCEHDRHADGGHGVSDGGASDSETVIGGVDCEAGKELLNSGDVCAENSSWKSGDYSVMDTDVDIDERSINSGDVRDNSDGNSEMLDYNDYSDDDGDGARDDDGDSTDGMDETDVDDSDSDVILISDEEENDVRTVAVPEVTRVVRSVTLTLRRTTTYAHGRIIHVDTEYIWDGSQTRTNL